MTAVEDTEGGKRFCADHARGINHPPHEWRDRTLQRGRVVIRYDCPGATGGKYASRKEWRAAMAAETPRSTPRR